MPMVIITFAIVVGAYIGLWQYVHVLFAIIVYNGFEEIADAIRTRTLEDLLSGVKKEREERENL